MKWLRSLLGGRTRRGAPTGAAGVHAESGEVHVLRIGQEDGNVHVLRLGGVLNKATGCLAACAGQGRSAGSNGLRALVVLADRLAPGRADDERGASSDQHEGGPARIAVVGNGRWHTEHLMLWDANRRSGEVRFFPSGQEAQARAWLTKEVTADDS